MKKLLTPLFCSLSILTFGQNVQLDPGFGTAGIAITPNTSEINCIARDSDGTILSAGYSIESGGTGIYHLTVSRHTANGTLVSDFGTNGIVTTAINHSEFPLDIQIQADGKILVCGSVYLGPTPGGPGDYHSFIVRYTPNGLLDNSFGVNGVLTLPHSDSHLVSMLLLDDGSILLAGNSYGSAAITKINANGTILSSFGNNGSVFLSGTNFQFVIWKAILLSDHSILCVGYDGSDSGNSKLAYCKINLDGSFATAFGQNGKVVIDLFNTLPEITEYLSTAKEAPNGEVFLAGHTSGGIILKVNPTNGSLYPNFGVNGVLEHHYPFVDFEIQPDGKFLIGGSEFVSAYNAGFTITRLNSDGNLDLSFNGTGAFTADVSSENDYLQTLKLIGPNTILVGGSSYLGSSSANFMLAKIVTDGMLNVNTLNPEEIAVYPNPFSDDLFFFVPEGGLAKIQLADAAGRIIHTFTSVENNQLHLGQLSEGMYQLIFTRSNGETSYQTIVKH